VSFLPYAVVVWVCLVGLYGVVTSRNLLHTIVCLSVVQSSTYVLLLAIGYRKDFAAPVFIDIPRNTNAVDPVVQALTLTDVVVGAAVTALLLAIAVQIQKHLGTVDPDELDPLRD
jgi:multicomponent Na+:H+ antiporter subunit C